MKQKSFIFFFLIALLLASCATTKNEDDYVTEDLPDNLLCPLCPNWKQICPGMEFTQFHINELGVKWACVKVDLQTLELKIKVFPKKADEIGKSFYVKDKIQEVSIPLLHSLALNTTPFDKNHLPMGVIQYDGEKINQPNPRYAALFLTKTDSGYSASIIEQREIMESIGQKSKGNSSEENKQNTGTILLGGYFQILNNAEILTFYKSRHSRTACGISSDQRYLYLFAASPDFSPLDNNGLYYSECASILLKLGAYNALCFDGGTSTSFYLDGQKLIEPFICKKVSAAIFLYIEQ